MVHRDNNGEEKQAAMPTMKIECILNNGCNMVKSDGAACFEAKVVSTAKPLDSDRAEVLHDPHGSVCIFDFSFNQRLYFVSMTAAM